MNQSEPQILRVVYSEEPVFVNNVNLESGTHDGHYNGPGIVMDILKIVGDRHNFKYKFMKNSDGIFGELQPDGSWNGMIGMLTRNEADVIAAATIVTEERKEGVDFTTPFMTTGSGMLIRSPDQFMDNRFLIVTAPLEWQVWALIAISILLSGFIYRGVCIGLKKLGMEVHFSLLDCVWIFYAIFVQQDLARLPSCAATRTMLSFWWLASLSICGFFTGNMVALFAVTRSVLPFNTRDDMVEKVKDDYKIVIQNSTLARINFIRNSPLQVFKDLWREMNSGKWINVSKLDQGIQTVIDNPRFIFIASKETLDAKASEICSVTTLDGDLIPVWYSIGVRKNASYLGMFNDTISKLTENGLVEKWLGDARMMQEYYRGTKCNTSLGAGIGKGGNIDIAGDAIHLEKAQGVFWLLVAGFCLAILSFLLERLWRLIRPNKHPIQKPKQTAVKVISVEPLGVEPQHNLHKHQDAIESVDSYKPKPKMDAFMKMANEKTTDKHSTNQYDNFHNQNTYSNTYVSVIGIANAELASLSGDDQNGNIQKITSFP